MSAKRTAAQKIIENMLPPVNVARMINEGGGGFAPEVDQLAFENVFVNLWARPGLSVRDRSLVTLGILIALRAESELHFHFPAAMRNGVSREELAEVIYHAAGYAGFPAAAAARSAAVKAFEE